MKLFRSHLLINHLNRKSRYLVIAALFITALLACASTDKDSKDNELSISDSYPKLIITDQNLDEFILKSKTTHKQLYDLTVKLADGFLERTPPQMKDASNVYREIGETLPSLGIVYLITKDDKYLKGAEKWIKALLNVPVWNGSQNLGRSAWTSGIAQTYDWLYQYLDEDLKKAIISRLKEEAKIIAGSAAETRALSNHLLIETCAVGTTGLILPEEDQDRAYLLGQAEKWTNYIIQNAPLDGSWGEGVQYWQYGLGYFLRFLEGAKTSGYHDYFPGYDWLKKTGRFPLQFSTPDVLTRSINFGDSGSDRYLPPALFYLPASKYNDGVVQDFAMKVQGNEPHKLNWFDFLTFDANVKPVDFRTVENTFYHFEDHGFVTMRSSWNPDAILVGFRCGPAPGNANQVKPERIENKGYGPGHQHPDINHFVIYGNGTWLAIDPGYTKLKETRNHNTLLVNGFGQAGAGKEWLDYMEFENRDPAPKITYTETTSSYDYVIGNAGNIYVDEAGLELFERQLMFVKPNIVIISDRLKANKSSDFNWLLQANEIAEIKKNNSNFDIVKKEATLSVFSLLPKSVNSDVSARTLKATDVNGDPNYNKDEALLRTVSLNATGSNVEYLTVLTVQKPGEKKPDVSIAGSVIQIMDNDRNIFINYNPEQELSKKTLELISR